MTRQVKVASGAPGSADGFRPVFPAATYGFECDDAVTKALQGKKSRLEIRVNLGGFSFGSGQRRPALLQWDGETYRDVTTVVDVGNNLVKGEVEELTSFVVFNQERSKPSKE